ncbi:hypothetical protein SADUNF_Sadunf16G0018600 [Salix dunnii]|uniref:Phytocyanin domain-containing protein n=1 Tax=Salix dunnii TaxID=1413687 RepID=A0A835JBV5_9ROSI|nr:hypothetical protein SADUNF_Sadunf16G0018600 [Salix dunnii]
MAMTKKIMMALVMVSVSLNVGAQVHHIVGGDRGWHPYTDIGSWSSARTFRVGDKIWFTHSAAQGRIAEVETKEEYLACDVSNAIRIYTDGITLDGEGARYFTNSNSEKCKNGLKLHVEVVPEARTDTTTPEVTPEGSDKAIAAPPESSASSHFGGSFALLMAGFWLSCIGLWIAL